MGRDPDKGVQARGRQVGGKQGRRSRKRKRERERESWNTYEDALVAERFPVRRRLVARRRHLGAVLVRNAAPVQILRPKPIATTDNDVIEANSKNKQTMTSSNHGAGVAIEMNDNTR